MLKGRTRPLLGGGMTFKKTEPGKNESKTIEFGTTETGNNNEVDNTDTGKTKTSIIKPGKTEFSMIGRCRED